MDKHTYNSLIQIIHYLYNDEQKNWHEAGEPAEHIYWDIKAVSEWAEKVEDDYEKMTIHN